VGGEPGDGPARRGRVGVPAEDVTWSPWAARGSAGMPEAACGNAAAPGATCGNTAAPEGDPVEETRGDGPMGAGTLVVTSSRNSKSVSRGGRDGPNNKMVTVTRLLCSALRDCRPLIAKIGKDWSDWLGLCGLSGSVWSE